MLLVSIHDVSPAQAPDIAELWAICRERGITPALLVVPNWHGAFPLQRHPQFVEWIRERAAEGAEIALHGERHDEVGLPRRASDSWNAWGKTDREGEFLTLDSTAARERLDRGLSLFRQLGLNATGFVPPAWLAREVTHEAAAAAGFVFSEDARSIRLLPVSRQVHSPVVRWSARTELRARGSVWVARVRTMAQRGSQFARIALHPSDLHHPAIARSVLETLDRWLQENSPGRYADIMASLAA